MHGRDKERREGGGVEDGGGWFTVPPEYPPAAGLIFPCFSFLACVRAAVVATACVCPQPTVNQPNLPAVLARGGLTPSVDVSSR